MAQRETAAQKRNRIAMLLADYDARSRDLRKLTKDVDTLKEQIREIPAGTYGEWTRAEGTPRTIVDHAAVKKYFAEHGAELPTKTTEAPIIVTHQAK